MSKDPTRVSAGRRSRRKGAGFELKLVKGFTEWWGRGSFARSPSSGGWNQKPVRDDFKACGDIITTNNDFPWCVEAKNQEGWSLDQLLLNEKCIIWAWWRQAVDETPEGLKPMLVFKKNRQNPLVMTRISDSEVYENNTFFLVDHPEYGRLYVYPLSDLFNSDAEEHRV